MNAKVPSPAQFEQQISGFVSACNTGSVGEYAMVPGGQITLYASCFAAMTLHYLGALEHVSEDERQTWAAYINGWQDPETGRFIGPEIVPEELTSRRHDRDHVTMHLTAHALPALHLLGARPAYPLHFAHPFLNVEVLRPWLEERDWRDAWLEGNNLLFIGQFLVHLRDFEGRDDAQAALDAYFDWLDEKQDPATGLWGTDGYCDARTAVYGGYHQLLVYYYCHRPVRHAESAIDVTLRIQQPDGSFSRRSGGGACEDVDAVDILVNLYERTGYRARAVRQALQRALSSVLTQQMPDGGFVYRRGTPFKLVGVSRTSAPADTSNLFATWFRVHTIALACRLIADHPLAKVDWRFNDTCSMGWHEVLPLPEPRPDPWRDRLPAFGPHLDVRLRRFAPAGLAKAVRRRLATARRRARALGGRSLLRVAQGLDSDRMLSFIVNLASQHVRQLSVPDGLRFLLGLDSNLYPLQCRLAAAYERQPADGPRETPWYDFLRSRLRGGERVLDIGCGYGTIVYPSFDVDVVRMGKIDPALVNAALALRRHPYPRADYKAGDALPSIPDGPFDVVILANVLEHMPARPAFLRTLQQVARASRFLIRVPLSERDWRVPLKRELGVEWRSDPGHETEYTLESFVEEIAAAGLRVVDHEVRWGDLWAEAVPDGSLGRSGVLDQGAES